LDVSPSARSTNWAARTSSLVSTVGPGLTVWGPAVGRPRAALRVICRVIALASVSFGAGSFD
jgi:hypothetical protein